MMKVFKEPLVHFLVLTLFLFVLDHVISSAKKEKIVVNRQTTGFLIKQREELVMRKLDSSEQDQIIASFVEDEILYSEAYKRGLDKGDSRMRRNLILKMRDLLSRDIKEPTEQQLRSYYEANREQYIRPASISLDHVYFSEQTTVPQGLLGQLRSGADHKTLGESRLGYVMPHLTAEVLVARFGAEGARGILAIDDEQWHGPFQSKQGLHFVRIYERSVEHPMSYGEIKSFLESEWLVEQSRKAIEVEMERIQENYEIVIEHGNDSQSEAAL